jgi:hypothetical protein
MNTMKEHKRSAAGVREIRVVGPHQCNQETYDGSQLLIVTPLRVKGEVWRISGPQKGVLEIKTNHPELAAELTIKMPKLPPHRTPTVTTVD